MGGFTAVGLHWDPCQGDNSGSLVNQKKYLRAPVSAGEQSAVAEERALSEMHS